VGDGEKEEVVKNIFGSRKYTSESEGFVFTPMSDAIPHNSSTHFQLFSAHLTNHFL